jgi:serine/threonine-protein kinase
MSVPPDCSEIARWQELCGDVVPPDQWERYERHLESCRACQERLRRAEGLGGDLQTLGRQFGDPTCVPLDPTLREVVRRLYGVEASARTPAAEPVDLYFLRHADRPDLLGTLGSYEVTEVVGQGGMGVVLKAFDPALQRVVAIKVLAPALAGSGTARQRFTREAQAAAAVRHDNLVTVHGVHEDDGFPYLVMQYVPGESLQERLDRTGPQDVEEVVRVGHETASGLAAAHALGLIHRDIKPANLLLEGGTARVKITDFGLARTADGVGLTATGVVAGTPEYVSPEQARGEPVDHRSDLFSLGSVLYALCAGAPPFRGSTALAVLRRVSDETPAPLRERNPGVPAWLEALVARLLAKDPAERFQTAAEVAGLLANYLAPLRQPGQVPAPALAAPPRPSSGQGDTEMSFACSGCGTNLKAKAEQAGKKVKCPRCGTAVLVPPPGPAAPRKAGVPGAGRWPLAALGLAVVGVVLVLVAARVLRPARPTATSFLDVPLGNQFVPGVDESGFYHDEENEDGRFRWTDGTARLVIPLDPKDQPRALFVQLFRPKTTWLQITVNGRPVVKAEAPERDIPSWERTLDLSGIDLGEKAIVEITGNTVIPREVDPARNTDSRHLGVRVRALRLLRQGVEMPASFLDLPLGSRFVAGVEDSGFHEDQQDKWGPYRWTNDRARLLIPLGRNERPQALAVLLYRPKDTWLRITVNQRELVNEPATDTDVFWWERTLDLSDIDLGEAVVVEIASNASASASDSRRRGVHVRWLKLLRDRTPPAPASFLDVPLGSRFVPGLNESGILDQGGQGDEPNRWTGGSASLTVPLGDKKPRTLAVTAFIPSPRGYWVRVTVNGTRLFDGPVRSSSTWSVELPLAGVDLGNSARIELESPTFVPAQVDPRSKDTRVLGIMVKHLVLRTDAAAEKQ